jgi:translocation and assembly module TamB
VTRARRFLLVITLLLASAAAGALWILATESGARWTLARTAGLLPEELTIGTVRGSFVGGLSVESVDWTSEPVTVSVRNVQVDVRLLQLLARHVSVAQLRAGQVDIIVAKSADDAETDSKPFALELPVEITLDDAVLSNISITAEGFDRRIDRFALQAGMRRDTLQITRLVLGSDWLDLDVDGRVAFAAPYPASLNADWRWKDVADLPLAGRLQADGDIDKLSVTHELAEPLQVSTTGSLALRNLTADLLNEWTAQQWVFGEQSLYSERGTLRVSGKLDAFDVDLAAVARLGELPETNLELRGAADPRSIRFSHLVAGNAMGQLIAAGDASWDGDPRVSANLQLRDFDTSLLAEILEGSIEVDAHIDATLEPSGMVLAADIERIGGLLRGLPVDGKGRVGFADGELTLGDAEIIVGTNIVRADGRIGESLAIDVEADIAELAELLPDTHGALRGTLALHGTRDTPALQVNITADALAWQTVGARSATVSATLPAGRKGSAELRASGLSIGETSIDEARVSVTGTLDRHDLRAELAAFDSALVMAVAGGYVDEAWQGQIRELVIDRRDVGRWATREPATLLASPGLIQMSSTCLIDEQGSAEVCIGIEAGANRAMVVDMSADSVPLAILPYTAPEGMQINGVIDARLHVERDDATLDGDAEIDLREASIEATYDGEDLAIGFTRASAVATARNGHLESHLDIELAGNDGTARLQLVIEDYADRQSTIAGQGALSIADASFVALFMPEISKPQGKIDGIMSIFGTLGEPDFLGEIVLSEGSLDVRQAGIRISDIEVRLAQLAPGRLQLSGRARSGEGQVRVEGRTDIGASTGIRSEVSVEGEDFQIARIPDWQMTASPSIRAVFDDQGVTVDGEVTVPFADIKVKELPASAQSASPDVVVHREEGKEPTARRRIDIDLRASLGDDVRLAAFGLTTGLSGSVQLQGGTHVPYTGHGKLSLYDGRYKAYGQDLEIERGELIFSGALDNPQLDVRAIRRTSDVVAGIQLSGTPRQIRSEVFSDPALSDGDALSYLLTGRPLASATSAGEGDTLNNAAFALGLSGAGTIASQIRTDLGLDTLVIEGGTTDSRLIAGKRFGDRLLVEYGYGLVDKLGTLLLRYELNERVILESRTGTVSNLDVVYRVKKK